MITSNSVSSLTDQWPATGFTRDNPPAVVSSLPIYKDEWLPFYRVIAGELVALIEDRRTQGPQRRFLFNVMAANRYNNEDFKSLVLDGLKMWAIKVFLNHHHNHALAAIEAADEVVKMAIATYVLTAPALQDVLRAQSPSQVQQMQAIVAAYHTTSVQGQDVILAQTSRTVPTGTTMLPSNLAMGGASVIGGTTGLGSGLGSGLAGLANVRPAQPELPILSMQAMDTNNLTLAGVNNFGMRVFNVPGMGQLTQSDYEALYAHSLAYYQRVQQEQQSRGLTGGSGLFGGGGAGGVPARVGGYGVGGNTSPAVEAALVRHTPTMPSTAAGGGFTPSLYDTTPSTHTPTYEADIANTTATVESSMPTHALPSPEGITTKDDNGEYFGGRRVYRNEHSTKPVFYCKFDNTLPFIRSATTPSIPLHDPSVVKLMYEICEDTGRVLNLVRTRYSEEEKMKLERHVIMMEEGEREAFARELGDAVAEPEVQIPREPEIDTELKAYKALKVEIPDFRHSSRDVGLVLAKPEELHELNLMVLRQANDCVTAYTTRGEFVTTRVDPSHSGRMFAIVNPIANATTLLELCRAFTEAQKAVEAVKDTLEHEAMAKVVRELEQATARAVTRRIALEVGIPDVSVTDWSGTTYDDLIKALDDNFGKVITQAFLQDERRFVAGIVNVVTGAGPSKQVSLALQDRLNLSEDQHMLVDPANWLGIIHACSLTSVDGPLESLTTLPMESGTAYGLTQTENAVLYTLCERLLNDKTYPKASHNNMLYTTDGKRIRFARSLLSASDTINLLVD